MKKNLEMFKMNKSHMNNVNGGKVRKCTWYNYETGQSGTIYVAEKVKNESRQSMTVRMNENEDLNVAYIC
jgi:hypothetical protein